jgi:hypothetical protein
MYSMVQAGSMGIPFVAVRGLWGSDLLTHRPDLRVVENPFQKGEPVVVAEPIRPDVAVFHTTQADCFGNALTLGEKRDDLMLARAARRVVVTAEEIVDGVIPPGEGGMRTFLPGIDVDQVVHAPGGAHPGGCGQRYAYDLIHLREYIEAAKNETTFKIYLEKYVSGPGNHQDYLSQVGFLSQK